MHWLSERSPDKGAWRSAAANKNLGGGGGATYQLLQGRTARENTNIFYYMSQILFGTYLHEKLLIFCRKFQFNGASWIFISCIWQLCSKTSWKPDLRRRKSNKPLACVESWVFSIHRLLTGFYLIPERNGAGILINHARETEAQAGK